MKKTRLQIELLLYFSSDINIEHIAERIPIIPTELKNKKDRNKSPNSDDNLEGFIRYSSGYLETLDLEDVCLNFIKTLLPAIEEIYMVIKQFNGQARFEIVVEIGKIKPSLYFSRQLLLITEKLEADIDIDMYIL